jgi:hypothetical protein
MIAASLTNLFGDKDYYFGTSFGYEDRTTKIVLGIQVMSVHGGYMPWEEKYFKYLEYLLKHKWYVFVECCKLGIERQGIIHDASKFDPEEWFAYTENFFGDKKGSQEVKNKFGVAWLHHLQNNEHHWEHWRSKEDRGETTILPMPEKYVTEMIADWIGAGKAISGKNDVLDWYAKNKDRMQLHPDTRKLVEAKLGV